MSVKINIGGNVITFPTSGTDANWSEAVVEFALAVEQQLAQVGLPYDVSPQVIPINESGLQTITATNFPNAEVKGFTFNYAIYRVASSPVTSKVSTGTVIGVYNEVTNNWVLEHEFAGDKQANGQPYVTFDMSVDALRMTITSIGGTYDTVNSIISFSAKTLPVTN